MQVIIATSNANNLIEYIRIDRCFILWPFHILKRDSTLSWMRTWTTERLTSCVFFECTEGYSDIVWLHAVYSMFPSLHKLICHFLSFFSLQWRNNGRYGVSNHQLTIAYWTVYSGADQRKQQRSSSLVFVRGIHRWPVNSPHKWPVTRKIFPFDDVIIYW